MNIESNIESNIQSLIDQVMSDYNNEGLLYKKQRHLMRAHGLVRAMHPDNVVIRCSKHLHVNQQALAGVETVYGAYIKADSIPVLNPSLTDDFDTNGKVIGHGAPSDRPQTQFEIWLPANHVFNNDDTFGRAYLCLVQYEDDLWLVRHSASGRNFWTARVLRVEGENVRIELVWNPELFELCESAPIYEGDDANTDRYTIYIYGDWQTEVPIVWGSWRAEPWRAEADEDEPVNFIQYMNSDEREQ